MKFVKVDCVNSSDLFDGCEKAWNIFCSSNPNCTWGDNIRSMVSAYMIGRTLLKEDSKNRQVKKVIKRIESQDLDFLVDLES